MAQITPQVLSTTTYIYIYREREREKERERERERERSPGDTQALTSHPICNGNITNNTCNCNDAIHNTSKHNTFIDKRLA